MGPKTAELIKVLEEMLSILEREKEQHWSQVIADCKKRIEKSDYSGIEKLLGCYGGMGSFNDLVLSPSTENKENEDLYNLRSKAWELAEAIRHDQ